LNEQEDPKTLLRQRVILEHLSGRLTATQAALELGVSRKTFYEWLERALSAMRSALVDRPGGRPAKALDPEKDQLREELAILEKERLVLESRLRIQEAMRQTLDAMLPKASPPKKKRPV
jgi:transposase-like protein